MNKPLLGLVLGAILGVIDSACALVSASSDPAVSLAIMGIVVGATVKGTVGGTIIGWFAKRPHSTGADVTFGFVIGLALAHLVCLLQDLDWQNPYYLQIIVPGGLAGLIVGYVTSKYGRSGATFSSGAPTKVERHP